ncbi:MAG: DUF1669 domain-containing protein [Helicobacteraceae bacterium]|nr:DUF1669 domain-containing protein [Helicobacteraceae bacterium]
MRFIFIFIMFPYFVFADSMYFMPYEAKEAINAIIKEIKQAKSEVNIAVYSFTNREISKAIRDTAKKGVRFNIIYDHKGNIDDNMTTIGYLSKLKNIYTCTLKGKLSNNKKYFGIMHNKLAIIDSKTIVFGSANWSKSAFDINYEMLLISQNKDYINQASKYFNKMLSECEKY